MVISHQILSLLNPPTPHSLRCTEAIDERQTERVISEVQAHTALGDSAFTH